MATLLPCAHSAGGFAWGSRAADHCPLFLGMAPNICPLESLRLSPDLLLKAEEFSDAYFPAHLGCVQLWVRLPNPPRAQPTPFTARGPEISQSLFHRQVNEQFPGVARGSILVYLDLAISVGFRKGSKHMGTRCLRSLLIRKTNKQQITTLVVTEQELRNGAQHCLILRVRKGPGDPP